jgi:Flp pilus assembly pilin Flp
MSGRNRTCRRSGGRWFRRFAREEHGVALVEFALALPLFLVLLATAIDGGRMLWSYQKAVAGVRDATRYVGRAADMGLCPGGSIAGHADMLERIVRNSVAGDDITPAGVTVVSVVPSLTCPAGAYRNGPVGVATVTATLRLDLPLSGVFALVGGELGTFDATITDRTRIFGS